LFRFRFSLQVHKYLLDHPRVFDTSDYLDSATASFADCNIDIEYALEALCPAHGGMPLQAIVHRRFSGDEGACLALMASP
jgi:hypothetical protein